VHLNEKGLDNYAGSHKEAHVQIEKA
jgi:hypothetical protein